MNALISATVFAFVLYFVAAFVSFCIDGINARCKPRPVQCINYFVEDSDPVEVAPVFQVVRPAPVVQTANLYQQCGIRQLKKLAVGRVKGYSSLTKAQLIAALA